MELHKMLDLAIGTPELGSLNLKVLNTFLHIVLNQLNIGSNQIALTDTQLEDIQSPQLNKPSDTQGKGASVVSLKAGSSQKVVPTKMTYPIDEDDAPQMMEMKGSQSQSKEHYDPGVRLATNKDLIKQALTIAESTPLTDMWNIITISKRMDAAEVGMTKVMSLLEDLAKKQGGQSGIEEYGTLSDFVAFVKDLERRLWNIENKMGGVSSSQKSSLLGFQGLNDQSEMALMRQQLNTLMENTEQFATLTQAIPIESLLQGIREMDTLRKKLDRLMSSTTEIPGMDKDEMEEKLNLCLGQMQNFDTAYGSQIGDVQSQMLNMEKELGELTEKLKRCIPEGDFGPSPNYFGLAELYKKIDTMQEDVDNINNIVTEFTGGHEERQLNMEGLLEEIEILKLVKANREDLEDALADKADYRMVNRKVSLDQFDSAYEDLSHGMEEALCKLKEQEALWQQALNEIQKEMESKLDKVEISPLREFINHKLKSIQTKLRALAEFHKETKAAASKKKLIRDVNCISCDGAVVMKADLDDECPVFPKWHPAKSMKPYLTFELGELEQQQKRLAHGKNLQYIQQINSEILDKIRYSQDEDEGEPHICSRYCGDSKNTATPNQRVSHLGHFLPECTVSDPKNKKGDCTSRCNSSLKRNSHT